jgi:hypothetical protein
MPNQPDEPNDDASEIVSALVHEIHEEQGEHPMVRTVTEKRGIREAHWVHFGDPLLHDRELEEAPANTHTLLLAAANRHLRAAGEMDYFAVMETAERIAPHGEYPSPETFSRHLAMWADRLKSQKGLLSIDAIAARFVQAQDRLFLQLNGIPELQAAALAYADAWHWLHMELFGEHELAAKAEAAERAADAAQQMAAKAEAGRREGPEAQRRNKALRLTIIAVEYKKYADDEMNPARRSSAKHVAAQIHARVNAALDRQGLGSLTVTTLEKRLRAIIHGA